MTLAPTIRRPLAVALLAAIGSLAACAAPGRVDDATFVQQAFARMKTLEGRYEAQVAGLTATVPVTYETISAGHALLERIHAGEAMDMASVYYLEGEDLAMVHYCGIGNRPHLRLDRDRSTRDDLLFAWDGGATDIDPSKDPHIHQGRFKFLDADTVDAEWSFWKDGKLDHAAHFTLSRKAGSFTPRAK